MNILIKGMRIPENCSECIRSNLRTAIKCAEWTEISAGRRENERALSCPLVDLENHGRMIVEDDAIETAWMILAGLGYRREENPQLEQTVREVYATAPKIEVE